MLTAATIFSLALRAVIFCSALRHHRALRIIFLTIRCSLTNTYSIPSECSLADNFPPPKRLSRTVFPFAPSATDNLFSPLALSHERSFSPRALSHERSFSPRALSHRASRALFYLIIPYVSPYINFSAHFPLPDFFVSRDFALPVAKHRLASRFCSSANTDSAICSIFVLPPHENGKTIGGRTCKVYPVFVRIV